MADTEGSPSSGEATRSTLQLHASAVARELYKLPARVRTDLGAVDELLLTFDGVVMLANAFVDPNDQRHWAEKIESVLDTFADVGEVYGPKIAEWIMALDEDALSAIVAKYTRDNYLSYVKRMIGEAAFHRLHIAVTADVDTVGAMARKALEGVLPYAVALDDVADVLTEEQIRGFMAFNPAGGVMIEMVFKLFDLLDAAVERVAISEHLNVITNVRSGAPATTDLVDLTADLRARISGQSRSLISDLNGVLDRKLRGAQDALAFSADSNSQAANSLIEFIDRLLRLTYTDTEVLDWLDANYPDLKDVKYADSQSGEVRPTKRGQALCFVHAHADVAQPSEMHLLVATSLAAMRKKLQVIKHADEGTEQERETIRNCMIGLEAFVHLGIGLSWSLVPDAGLSDLKSRLNPGSSASQPDTVEGQIA